jgi:3D (Asp-Asp-Asp) domain-containing protein
LGSFFLSTHGMGAERRLNGMYVATAYSQTGVTASGQYTHRHVVAADPEVLPIGSRIRIRNAGRYSGEYVVADTGGNIRGRRLDIYMPRSKECVRFGARNVRVKVIELGTGTPASAKEADQKVKVEVADDLQKGAVGRAATDVDWAAANAGVEEARNRPPARQPREEP